MKLNYQYNEEERKIAIEVEKIQMEYARKVREYAETLPPKHHRLVYNEACSPDYVVSLIFADFNELLDKE